MATEAAGLVHVPLATVPLTPLTPAPDARQSQPLALHLLEQLARVPAIFVPVFVFVFVGCAHVSRDCV